MTSTLGCRNCHWWSNSPIWSRGLQCVTLWQHSFHQNPLGSPLLFFPNPFCLCASQIFYSPFFFSIRDNGNTDICLVAVLVVLQASTATLEQNFASIPSPCQNHHSSSERWLHSDRLTTFFIHSCQCVCQLDQPPFKIVISEIRN